MIIMNSKFGVSGPVKLPRNFLLNSLSKVDFFCKSFNRKLFARFVGTSFSRSNVVKLPLLVEQREKTVLFFQDDLWQDEELFRTKYFLKVILSFKKNRDNVMLPYFLKSKMDKNAVRKYLKLMSAYLQNALVENIDQINSKFFIFFYFLTKLPLKLHQSDESLFYKKNLLLRNLFFIFFFSRGRMNYFFMLTKFNSLISKTYFSFKSRRIRHIRTIFPRGLFLLLYSPFRSSYGFSSFKQIIFKRKHFFSRLKFMSKYLFKRYDVKGEIKSNKLSLIRSQKLFIRKLDCSFSKFLMFTKSNFSLASSNNYKSILLKRKKHESYLNPILKFKRKNCGFLNSQISIKLPIKQQFFKFCVNKTIINKSNIKYLKLFLKKLISKVGFFLHYLESAKFYSQKKSRRKLLRNLSKFFFIYFKFIKSFSRMMHQSIFNFRYNFLHMRSFLFYLNNIIKNLNAYKLNNMKKLNFLYFDFSIGSFFEKKTPLSKSFKYLNAVRVVNKKIKKKKSIFSIVFRSNKLKNSGNVFRYFWLLLSSKQSIDFYKSFSIFLNSYVSVASRSLNCFISFKKFSYVLWFIFFSSKTDYSQVLKVINNYNQFLYFVTISNNRKDFSYFLKFLPLFLHYPVLKEVSIVSSSLTSNLIKIFDSILYYYRISYNKHFSRKFDQFFLSSEIKKIPLVLLKKIRKTPTQIKIIEKQNLANIENLKLQSKRLLQKKRVSLLPKISDTAKQSVAVLTKKNKVKSKKQKFLYLKYKNLQKFKREQVLRKIKKRKSIFWKNLHNYLGLTYLRVSYFNRAGGKRYRRHKVERRRKMRRFFNNVMFMVKFIKEKKILKSYYKFNERSFRLSRFHRFSSPFFLRLKIKRLHSFTNKKRLIYRTSFLSGASSNFSATVLKSIYFSFTFFTSQIQKNFFLINNKFYSSYFPTKVLNVSSINNLSILKNWLLLIKNNYYLCVLRSFIVFLPLNLKDYFILLKFFFKFGLFFFVNIFFSIFFEIISFLRFLIEIKTFYFLSYRFVLKSKRSLDSLVYKNFSFVKLHNFLFSRKFSTKQSLNFKKTKNSIFKRFFLPIFLLKPFQKKNGTLFLSNNYLLFRSYNNSVLSFHKAVNMLGSVSFIVNYVLLIFLRFFYYKKLSNLVLVSPYVFFDFFPLNLNLSFRNLLFSSKILNFSNIFHKIGVNMPSVGFFTFFYTIINNKKIKRRQIGFTLKNLKKKSSKFFKKSKVRKHFRRKVLNKYSNPRKKYELNDFFFKPSFSFKKHNWIPIGHQGNKANFVDTKFYLRHLYVKSLKKKMTENKFNKGFIKKNNVKPNFVKRRLKESGLNKFLFLKSLNKLNFMRSSSYSQFVNSPKINKNLDYYKRAKSFNFSSKFYFISSKNKRKNKRVLTSIQNQKLYLNSFTFIKNCFRSSIITGPFLDSKIKDLSKFLYFKTLKSFLVNLNNLKSFAKGSQDSVKFVKVADFFSSCKKSFLKFYYISLYFKLRRYLGLLSIIVNQRTLLVTVIKSMFVNSCEILSKFEFSLAFFMFVDQLNLNFKTMTFITTNKLKISLNPLVNLCLLFLQNYYTLSLSKFSSVDVGGLAQNIIFCFMYLRKYVSHQFFLGSLSLIFFNQEYMQRSILESFFFFNLLARFSLYSKKQFKKFSSHLFNFRAKLPGLYSVSNPMNFKNLLIELFSLYVFIRKYEQTFGLVSSLARLPYKLVLLKFSKSFIKKIYISGYIKFVKYKNLDILFLKCTEKFFFLINEFLFVFLQKFLLLDKALLNSNIIRFINFLNTLFFDNLFRFSSFKRIYFLILNSFYKNSDFAKKFANAGILTLKLKTVRVILNNYYKVRKILYGNSFFIKTSLLNFVKFKGIKSHLNKNKEYNNALTKDFPYINSQIFNNFRKFNVLWLKNYYFQRYSIYCNSLYKFLIRKKKSFKKAKKFKFKKFNKKYGFRFIKFFGIPFAKNSRYGRQFINLINYRKIKGVRVFTKFIKKPKNNGKVVSSNFLDSTVKMLPLRLKVYNRSKMSKYHSFLRIKFHSVLFHKIFLGLFLSPRFFNFKSLKQRDFFLDSKLNLKLKKKVSLFFKLTRFLEFLISISYKVRSYILKQSNNLFFLDKFQKLNTLISNKYFHFIFKLYKNVKIQIKKMFQKLAIFRARRNKGISDRRITRRTSLNFAFQRFRFSFFYNFFGLNFLKFFVLRYFFSEDFTRFRLQFVNRFFWFRSVQLNSFLYTAKTFIIISKVKNNFFITGIDLFGRILYKSSPGMVHFTGSDRMSKYAWFDTSVDFSDGFIEFFKYFLRGRRRQRSSMFRILRSRSLNYKETRLKKRFGAAFDPKRTRRYKRRLLRRRNKLRVRLRRFFIISKGVSDFNLRIFLKGLSSNRFFLRKFVGGFVNYPMRSFSLCRIKKVRRK